MLPTEDLMGESTPAAAEAPAANHDHENGHHESGSYNEDRFEVLHLDDEDAVDEFIQTEESKQFPRQDPTAFPNQHIPNKWNTDGMAPSDQNPGSSSVADFPPEDLPLGAEAPAGLIPVLSSTSNTYYLMTEEQHLHYVNGREWARSHNIGANIDNFFAEMLSGGDAGHFADDNNNRNSGGGAAPLSCREEMRRNGSDL